YVAINAVEPLTILTAEGEFKPWLAERAEQVSPTEWEYDIRDGVKFWDGNPVTVDDVIFSLEHYGAPESVGVGYFVNVDSIEPADDDPVKVTLTNPDPTWPYTVASGYSAIFEKAYFEANEDTYGDPGTLVMGTGPWKFESLDPTAGAELVANPDWWG